jgi:hypothetical protein
MPHVPGLDSDALTAHMIQGGVLPEDALQMTKHIMQRIQSGVPPKDAILQVVSQSMARIAKPSAP